MHTQASRTVQQPTGEKPAITARNGWNRSRIQPMAFWATTFVIAFELAAGSVWNLVPIEWIEIQLRHLGYPHFVTYILGGWQAGAAIAIVVPRFPLIKEWAYAGALFLWSGAVLSHLAVGDGVTSWGPPLMFGVLGTASWMLRPADRRLAGTRLRRYRPAGAGPGGAERSETRPRAWVVSIGLLVALYTVSFLTLPVAEAAMREQAVERGWIHE